MSPIPTEMEARDMSLSCFFALEMTWTYKLYLHRIYPKIKNVHELNQDYAASKKKTEVRSSNQELKSSTQLSWSEIALYLSAVTEECRP